MAPPLCFFRMLMPSTEVAIPVGRVSGTGFVSSLGSGIISFVVGPTVVGGFATVPMQVPLDYDRSRPGRLWIFTYQGSAAPAPSGGIQIDVDYSRCPPNGTPVNAISNNVYVVPAGEVFGLLTEREFLAFGGGPLFPASFFNQRDTFGLLIRRNGAAALDTWANSLGFVLNCLLRYSRLCQHCDSCT